MIHARSMVLVQAQHSPTDRAHSTLHHCDHSHSCMPSVSSTRCQECSLPQFFTCPSVFCLCSALLGCSSLEPACSTVLPGPSVVSLASPSPAVGSFLRCLLLPPQACLFPVSLGLHPSSHALFSNIPIRPLLAPLGAGCATSPRCCLHAQPIHGAAHNRVPCNLLCPSCPTTSSLLATPDRRVYAARCNALACCTSSPGNVMNQRQ